MPLRHGPRAFCYFSENWRPASPVSARACAARPNPPNAVLNAIAFRLTPSGAVRCPHILPTSPYPTPAHSLLQATSRHRHLCSPRGLGVCGQAFAICNPAWTVKQQSIAHTGNSYFPYTTAYNNTCGKAEQRPIDSSAYRPYPAAGRSFASSVNIQSPKARSRLEHLNHLKEKILPRITASHELFIDNHNLRLPFGSWLFAPFFRSNR